MSCTINIILAIQSFISVWFFSLLNLSAKCLRVFKCCPFQALYIQDNKLKQLPNSLGSLKNLQTLNISGNCLKEIPLSISGLVSLKTLDVRKNPKLKRIPKEVAHLRGLETLLLDEEHINYPQPEKVPEGSKGFLKVPEDSRRFKMFKNTQEPPKSFKKVFHFFSWYHVWRFKKVQNNSKQVIRDLASLEKAG